MSRKQEYDKRDYEFLRHEPCPTCGGSDSVAVWRHKPTGGVTKYCNSEKNGKCDYKITTASLYRSSQPGGALPDSWLDKKHLTAEVAKRYRITRDGKVIYFGVATPEGKVVGIAGRNYGIPKHQDKHFFWKQSSNLLYGMDTCTGYDKLIIVSGFWDAPSAYSITGWNSVSLPNGDKSVRNAITDNYQWLKRFKRIYVAFDNDAPGQSAAQTAMEILGYRARQVILPDFTVLLGDEIVTVKDSSDFLVYGLQKEYMLALQAADTRLNPYVYNQEADLAYANYKLQMDGPGWNTGISELDALITFRPNEFTLFFGAPGRGKSTFARFLITALHTQCRPYYISLEDPIWVCIDNLATSLLGEHTPYDAYGQCQLTEKELIDRSRRVRELVSLAHLESCTPEILADAIECAYVQYGCKFIIIDHITWLLNLDDDQRNAAVKYMNVISDLCKRFPIHVFIVSHNKPLDSAVQRQYAKKFQADWEEYLEPTPRDAQWSSVFEQISWNILGWKNPSDTDTPAKLFILKNRTGGMKKLGSVMLYFDDDTKNYMGITQYAKQQASNRKRLPEDRRDSGSISLLPGEGDFGNVQSLGCPEREIISSLHGEERRESQESDRATGTSSDETASNSSDTSDTGVTTISTEIQGVHMESGLLLSLDREPDRVQGENDGQLPHSGRNIRRTTPELVQEIKADISKAGYGYTTQKQELPGVGRESRARVDLLRPGKIPQSRLDTALVAEINFPVSDKWAELL